MTQSKNPISLIIEGALFASSEPMSLNALKKYLPEGTNLTMGELREILTELEEHYEDRGINLVEVASGYRFQISPEATPHLATFYEDKPQKFSRAFMETLALIAYRQPITRGEIEEIRGIVVSSNIIKTLTELEWIRVVGHKEVPGKPALLATTNKFLDFFGLSKLEELPPLSELKELTNEMIPDGDANALGEAIQESKLLQDDEETEEETAVDGEVSEENAELTEEVDSEIEVASADEREESEVAIDEQELAEVEFEEVIDEIENEIVFADEELEEAEVDAEQVESEDEIEVTIANEPVEDGVIEVDPDMADNDPESTTDRFPQVLMTGPELPSDEDEDLDNLQNVNENE